MSAQANFNPFGNADDGVRKTVSKRLTSGQTISLTVSIEKMLRAAYDYAQGFAKRALLENYIAAKKQEVADAAQRLPANSPLRATLMQAHSQQGSSRLSVTQAAPTPSLSAFRNGSQSAQPPDSSHGQGQGQGTEGPTQECSRLSQELAALQENAQQLAKLDSKVTLPDLEALLKTLGISPQRRVLEHMIYEVDEQADDAICWEEFQLAYYRNVNDVTGSEPSSFFRIIEFLTFDPLHKGFIMEDDVMEVLFIRLGAARLEHELKSIFGNALRALGGPGTLSLESYLGACLRKTGRRALVT